MKLEYFVIHVYLNLLYVEYRMDQEDILEICQQHPKCALCDRYYEDDEDC